MDIKTNDTDSVFWRILVEKGRCSINQLFEYLVPFDKRIKGNKTLQEGFTGGFSNAPQMKENQVRETLGRLGLSGRRQIEKSEVDK